MKQFVVICMSLVLLSLLSANAEVKGSDLYGLAKKHWQMLFCTRCDFLLFGNFTKGEACDKSTQSLLEDPNLKAAEAAFLNEMKESMGSHYKGEVFTGTDLFIRSEMDFKNYTSYQPYLDACTAAGGIATELVGPINFDCNIAAFILISMSNVPHCYGTACTTKSQDEIVNVTNDNYKSTQTLCKVTTGPPPNRTHLGTNGPQFPPQNNPDPSPDHSPGTSPSSSAPATKCFAMALAFMLTTMTALFNP